MKKFELNWNTGLILTMFIYVLSHLLMVLTNGVWWDDYVVWNVSPEQLYNYLGPSDANEAFQYHYIALVTANVPLQWQVPVFRLLALFFHGVTLLCCWNILKLITKNFRFTLYVSLLMATFGLDKTNFLIICSHYTIANCLFFVGLWAIVYDYYYNKIYLRYLAALLWFASLFVWRSPALLIPFTVIVASCAKVDFQWRSWSKYKEAFMYALKKYWSIIGACVLFLLVYKVFLAQDGNHASYYVPKLSNLLLLPFTTIVSSIESMVLYWGSSILALAGGSSLTLAVVAVFLVGVFYYCVRTSNGESSYKNYAIAWLSLIFLMLTMVLPLMIFEKGEIASIGEYKSRLFNLAALPVSVITVWIINHISVKYQKYVLVVLLTGSLCYTTNTYVDYAFSLTKTNAIVSYLREHPELDGEEIVVKDFAFSANENEAGIRAHAYKGMAKLAYGQETQTKMHSYYHCYYLDYTPRYELDILQKDYPISLETKYTIVLSKYFMKGKFNRLTSNMFDFRLIEQSLEE